MYNLIHMYWNGPFTFDKLPDDDKYDFGIYQVYGYHPIYGNNTLLYIGQTETTLKKRLANEFWHKGNNFSNTTYYLGRIGIDSIKLPIPELLDIVEKILIASHAPAYNADHVQDSLDDLKEFRILNWDNYNLLLPEISVERHSSKFWDSNKYSNKTISK